MPADELELYITKDRELYEKGRKLIYAKLADAKLAGNYSRAVALREFKSLADKGAKKYQREVQARYFTSDEKKAYAESAADYFEAEWNIGNMREYATSASQWNPAHSPKQNPWEVHSESGLEGVFADEDDARFYAEEIRGGGARQIRVERRVRQLPSRNPSDPAWQVSRSVTNVAQGIGFLGGDVNKATSYFRHVGVEVQGVGYGWLERCYAEPSWETGKMEYTCLVELTDGQVDAFAADEVWPVAGRYPESPRRRRSNPSSRLFSGVYPTGIVYADKARERDGDYLRVAFLPFSTLQLEWAPGVHPAELRAEIERDAAAIIAKRGQQFPVDASGHTVTLGRRNPIEMHENPGARVLRERYGDSSTIVVEHNRYGITGWLESGRGGGRMPISFGATKPDTLRQAMELAKKFLAGVYGKSNPAKNPARRRETEVPINKTSVVGVDPINKTSVVGVDPHGFAYVVDEHSGVSFMGPRASSIARELGLQAVHEAPVTSYAPDPERKQRLAEWQDLFQARRRTNPKK